MATNALFPPPITTRQKAKISAIYFVTFMAICAVSPYLSLYYNSIGFTGSQIGLLLGIGSLLSLFATPFWTGIADSTGKHALVMVGGVIAMAGLHALIPSLASFVPVLIVVILIGLTTPQILPLEDSAAMHMLGPQRSQYGRLRLWGSIGWGLGALVYGPIYDAFGLQWMFWCFSLVMITNLALMRGLQFDNNPQSAKASPGIANFLKEPSWWLFLTITFLTGVGVVTYQSFMPLVIGGLSPADLSLFSIPIPPSTLIGLTMVVGTLSELPVMLFSDKLLNVLKVRNLALVSLAMAALRVLIYAFDVNAVTALLAQVLHGMTFVSLWLAGVDFVGTYAPPGLKATGLGLFNMTLLGLGYFTGNMVSGALVDLVGLRSMFAIIAAVLLAGLLAAWLIDRRAHLLDPSPQ